MESNLSADGQSRYYTPQGVEGRLLLLAVIIDYLGPTLIGLSGKRMPEIIDSLNETSSVLVPLWYLSDFLGPAVLITLMAASAAKALKTFALWVVMFAALYIGWQLSKAFLATISPWWTPVILAVLLLTMNELKPSMDVASERFGRFMAGISRSRSKQALLMLWRLSAAYYGVFLLIAILTVLSLPVYFGLPLSLVEIASSTTVTVLIIRIWRRGNRLSAAAGA